MFHYFCYTSIRKMMEPLKIGGQVVVEAPQTLWKRAKIFRTWLFWVSINYDHGNFWARVLGHSFAVRYSKKSMKATAN